MFNPTTIASDPAALLEPGGAVASALGAYEDRPQQTAMARAVHQALADDRLLVVEAGTGVGKSLAYLTPAIVHAVSCDERVVVSTNTINLQEQLLRKDIPVVARALGLGHEVAAVLKGRSNYLCRRRLSWLVTEGADEIPEGTDGIVATLVAWAGSTDAGTRSDLPVPVRGDLWDELCSDRDRCGGGGCPHAGSCFFLQARRRAAEARIVVVNHHLLLADVVLRGGDGEGPGVVPLFDRLVVDEAHHLEETARRHLGSSVTTTGLARVVEALGGDGPRRRSRSVLPRILAGLSGPLHATGTAGGRRVVAAVERCAASAAAVGGHVREVSRAAAALAARGAAVEGGGAGTFVRRIAVDARLLGDPTWRMDLAPALVDLRSAVAVLAGAASEVASAGADLDELQRQVLEVPLAEIGRAQRGVMAAADGLDRFLDASDEGRARWIEMGRGGGGSERLEFASSPFDVAGPLHDGLFAATRTTVLTSATLTVNGSFAYTLRSLGLVDEPRVDTLHLDSPFEYDEQGFLGVIRDMPDPRLPAFSVRVGEVVREAVGISEGRAFVLFTSYRMLREVHDALADDLWRQGHTVLRQGEASRERLLDSFRDEPSAVLFGTSSFWEGVDVQGDALSCVVIVKVPFQVPTDPMVAARGEWLKQRGLDPFRDESLPRATLLLKQGMGRLIRSRTDRGVVLLLDSRVATRPYGRGILASLPPFHTVAGTWTGVRRAMTAFVEDGGR